MDVWLILVVVGEGTKGKPPSAVAFIAAFQQANDAEQAVREEVVAPILSITIVSLPEAVALAFKLEPRKVRRLADGAPMEFL